jgi:hypothetical protein
VPFKVSGFRFQVSGKAGKIIEGFRDLGMRNAEFKEKMKKD